MTTQCTIGLGLTAGLLFAAAVGCVAPPVEPNPALELRSAPANTNLNVPFWTLGGKQLWADELWLSGWRIQKSVVSGHHRLLDSSDVRRAWGNFDGCLGTLERLRDAGDVDPVAQHIVVVLHGIWRSKDSLGGLTSALRDAGYQVADINYPSTRWPIESCAIQIERVLNRLPSEVESISFVTHSMGGLVARRILGSAAGEGDWRARIDVGCLVMIFPPNQGAAKADGWRRNWLYEKAFGPAGQQLTTDVAPSLPIPDVPTGVIAGGRGDGEGRNGTIDGDDDGTVAVSETLLPGAEHVVFDVGHTFGMNDERTVGAVLRFLVNGKF